MFSGILIEFHVSVFNLGLYVSRIFCFSSEVADTVHGERFPGLNIRCFSAIEIFTEILSHCLGLSVRYLVQLKRGTYIHG